MCFPGAETAILSFLGGSSAVAGPGLAVSAAGASALLPAGMTAAAGAGAGAAGAGAAGAGMSALQTASLYASIAGAGLSGVGMYNQAQTAKAVAQANAREANRAAQGELRQGEQEAHEVRQRAAALKGTQRAAMAARGLDLESGTPGELIDQTDFFSSVDQATARNNARRKTQGLRSQSANFSMEAAGYSPLATAGASLLTQGGTVADRWYTYKGR